ncbi:MAG: dTMP kinase [Candidatus Latescibacterota bacterium]|nr:MAG: dTMP kinase [Candidatus Latescibacterota bacterium]
MAGALVAFEGIDQAGKMTQARSVQARLRELGVTCELRGYPEYATPIGRLIQASLRDTPMDARARVMLFAANRWEKDAEIRQLVERHALVLVDRYTWSNVVYGAAQGFDEEWVRNLENGLQPAHLTLFLDIPAAESIRRKSMERDGFERNVELLESARAHYLRLSKQLDWVVVDGERPQLEVTAAILRAMQERLSRRVPLLARGIP